MLIRAALTALDFNNNVDRGFKTDAEGNKLYKSKVDSTVQRNQLELLLCFNSRLTDHAPELLLQNKG